MVAFLSEFCEERLGLREFGAIAEEARSREVDIGEREPHRAALGDLLRFGQGVAAGGQVAR